MHAPACVAFVLLAPALLAFETIATAKPAFAMTSKAYQAEIDKLFMNTQFHDAQRMASKAMKEYPKDKLIYLTKMGEMYIVAAKGREGLEAGREAARLAPNDAKIKATCSILEFLSSYVVKAEQMAESAVSLDASNGRAHAALALSGLRDENIPIKEELDAAMKLSPRDPIVFAVAGTIHLRKLEYDLAERAYSQLVKAYPNAALPYYMRAYFRREVFNNNGALRDFDEVVKRYSEDHYVLTTRAKLNKKTGRYKEAINDFNMLEKLQKTAYNSFARRAECYEKLGNYDLAVKDYKKSLDVMGVTKPGWDKKYAKTMGSTRRSAWTEMMDSKDAGELSSTKSTWLKLIMLEEKHGDFEDALKQLTHFMSVFPGDLNSIHARHKLFKRTGRWTEALGDINLLISKNPNVADYYQSRADIKHLNKPDKAAEDLKRVHNLETTGSVTGD